MEDETFIAHRDWPEGKPIFTEDLPDGRKRHTMQDGRQFTVGAPSHRIDYLSTWIGVKPRQTYQIRVAFAGLSAHAGFCEAWNFEIDELRSYAFHKIVRIVDLSDGWECAGEDLRAQLGGVNVRLASDPI